MGKTTAPTEETLRQELIALNEKLFPIERKPGEFTLYEYAEAIGITPDAASARLKRAMQKGEFACRKIIIDGKRTNVYRVVK